MKNKNIIITGTSRGIGYELALQFANEGHQVLAISRKTPQALIENPNITCLSIDISNPDELLQVENFINQTWKKVDILTIEIEQINVDALFYLENEGVKVYPKPSTVKVIQDKGLQKMFYQERDIPTAGFQLFNDGKEIKEALKMLFINDGILTFPGGHSGLQYGGWYKELPVEPSFFKDKTIRFANFAGYLLSQPSIGAKLKPMLRYQFESMIDHINFDVVEWENPEEDLKLGMNLKGFRYYDSSNWNEPNAMFSFCINKDAIDKLPTDVKNTINRISL